MSLALRLRHRLLLAVLLTFGTAAQAAPEVNLATQADLESLPGVGPDTSARILAAREQAPFSDWADLLRRVKGLGPATAAKLSTAGLTVQGTSYTAPK